MTSQKLIYLIVSTAVDEPEGAPSGVIYAALQGHVDYVTYVETVDALREGRANYCESPCNYSDGEGQGAYLYDTQELSSETPCLPTWR